RGQDDRAANGARRVVVMGAANGFADRLPEAVRRLDVGLRVGHRASNLAHAWTAGQGAHGSRNVQKRITASLKTGLRVVPQCSGNPRTRERHEDYPQRIAWP